MGRSEFQDIGLDNDGRFLLKLLFVHTNPKVALTLRFPEQFYKTRRAWSRKWRW